MVFLPLVLVLAGCGSGDAPGTSTLAGSANASLQPAEGAGQPLTGLQTFVIVPEQSKASYLANEEFFAGALKKLGIAAGKRKVVGNTQAIEGQFQFDPERLTARLGENAFTVRMNTFTTNQPSRDKYIREDGPSFNAYPLATFRASAIDGGSSTYRTGEDLNFKLTGDLTIRKIAKRVTFDVKAQLVGDTITGLATTRLLMSDFGIAPLDFYNTLTVADAFGIEVRFTARAQARSSTPTTRPGPGGRP